MAAPMEIRSRDNPLLVRLRKLAQDPAAYRRQGEIFIEGDHLCGACVARGREVEVAVVTDRGHADPALRALAGHAKRTVVVPEALFAGVSTLESPASIGFLVPWPGAVAPLAGRPTLVLDRLQDAGNVGSILRSAAAFGVEQVVAIKGTAALWSPKVVRAGMGAHFALHLVEGAAPADVSALGVPLVGTSSHAAAELPSAALPWPCAWLLGHEGQGADAALLDACALTLRIPQPGGEESLNVAAAAAICLYESARRRAG